MGMVRGFGFSLMDCLVDEGIAVLTLFDEAGEGW